MELKDVVLSVLSDIQTEEEQQQITTQVEAAAKKKEAESVQKKRTVPAGNGKTASPKERDQEKTGPCANAFTFFGKLPE